MELRKQAAWSETQPQMFHFRTHTEYATAFTNRSTKALPYAARLVSRRECSWPAFAAMSMPHSFTWVR